MRRPGGCRRRFAIGLSINVGGGGALSAQRIGANLDTGGEVATHLAEIHVDALCQAVRISGSSGGTRAPLLRDIFLSASFPFYCDIELQKGDLASLAFTGTTAVVGPVHLNLIFEDRTP